MFIKLVFWTNRDLILSVDTTAYRILLLFLHNENISFDSARVPNNYLK